jgi:hypothetical protein
VLQFIFGKPEDLPSDKGIFDLFGQGKVKLPAFDLMFDGFDQGLSCGWILSNLP